MKLRLLLCLVLVSCFLLPKTMLGATWYVRADGGTRYSTDTLSGQCDGQADAAYPGQGTDQHCAFADFRSLWNEQVFLASARQAAQRAARIAHPAPMQESLSTAENVTSNQPLASGKIATTTSLQLTSTEDAGIAILTLAVIPDSGTGSPTGKVSLSVYGTVVATVTLKASDVLVAYLPTAVDKYTLTASYAGDSNFYPSAYTLPAGPPVTPASPLVISSVTLPAATVGASYSTAFQATGGTPPYTWSIGTGSLPAGLSLDASSGTVSGTPTVSGTFSLTAQVLDSGIPAQAQVAATSLTVVAAALLPTNGTTWFVRPDGGTRYSTNVTTGQCNGLADAPYPGAGVNQACAFNDVRYLYQDGSYADGSATFPAYGWVGTGGNTYLIRGSIASGVSYRIGWNNNVNSYDGPTSQYWGFAGDPYDSGIPTPPSGTPNRHTHILGENYGACHSAGAKTQLHGGFALATVLSMQGASYVDVACLDITDNSACGRYGQANACSNALPGMDDYAQIGIHWSNLATNDTLTDVHIHGLANSGMVGPTGTGMVFNYLDLLGNAASGWNADNGDGTAGTGTLLVENFNIGWNGCAEEYPAVDAVPYGDCSDDGSGGYGDGFGTSTNGSNPGWQITFKNGNTFYNTQDGLDALHVNGAGSSLTFLNTREYGNMGQQLKVGSAGGTVINNVVVGNCNALRQAIPGTPIGFNSKLSDFCRAADTTIVMQISDGTKLTFDDNTVYSASATGLEIDCYNGDTCTTSSQIDYRNNIFVGFPNTAATGYPSGGSGVNSNPVYMSSENPFTAAGSLYSNNVTFNPSSHWACPAAGESNAICGDPQLTDETFHLYGYGDMTPTASSIVDGAGVAIPSVTTDYSGTPRTDPPTIGAYQQ